MDAYARAVFRTDLGWMCAAASGDTLGELTFNHRSPTEAVAALRFFPGEPESATPFLTRLIGRLQRFCSCPDDDFLDVPLEFHDRTQFQRAVLEACRSIRPGETTTYGALARLAGRPHAARAVGQVMATNRYPLIVPCHRVLGSNGSIGGYSARDGLDLKRRLLQLESRPRTDSLTV